MAIRAAQPRLTVAQYYQMLADGELHEDDRVELIEGELHWMSPINNPHAHAVRVLNRTLVLALGDRAVVDVQNPIHLDDGSEPQPDLYVARWRRDFYSAAHPTAADLVLVIEVADTSVRYDRLRKDPLYARAGIPEYWLVDLEHGTVDAYSDPQGGRYHRHAVHRRGAALAPAAFPDVRVPVDDVLGPDEGSGIRDQGSGDGNEQTPVPDPNP